MISILDTKAKHLQNTEFCVFFYIKSCKGHGEWVVYHYRSRLPTPKGLFDTLLNHNRLIRFGKKFKK